MIAVNSAAQMRHSNVYPTGWECADSPAAL